MAGEQLNLEFLVKVINDTKAGMDSVIADYKRLGAATASASKQGDTIGGAQQQQRMSGLHTRITQLTGAFRKFGIELETIDLYFISGFKVVGLFKLLEFAKQSVLAFEDYRKGIIGIQLATEQSGQSMEESMTTFNNLLKMGKIGAVDLAEAVRNLLKRGMDTKDVEKVIRVLTMSGTVFGTQHGVPLGEAVKRSTEGLLLEISNLVDATRLTKNLKDVFKDYGKTIGKTGDQLDQYEKNLAIVAWMTQENIGLAEKYSQANVGVTAALSEFGVTFDKLKREIGEGLNIPVTWTVKGATSLLEGFMYDFNLLNAAIKTQNLYLGIPIKFISSTGWAFIKDLFAGGNIFTQEFTTEPIVSAFKAAFTAAKQEVLSFSQELDNIIYDTFGENSLMYKIFGQGMVKVDIVPSISNLAASQIKEWQGLSARAFSGTDILNQHLSENMWWNKKEETGGTDFGKMIDARKLEQARKAGEKIAQAFSYPLERGISDVFFGLFTGQKKSFAEMARNFGLAMGRAISDALAEALMMPVKKIMTSMFTSMAGSVLGGGLGNLFTAKTAIPTSTPIPDSITINSPITVHANDTNSFAKTLKQTSKLAAGLMVKEMRKSRNMEKQFRRK